MAEEVIRCFRGEDGQSYSRKNGFIEITIPIYDAQSKEDGRRDDRQYTDQRYP